MHKVNVEWKMQNDGDVKPHDCSYYTAYHMPRVDSSVVKCVMWM